MEKYCKKCDTTKPVSEFHKKAAEKDGFARYCKECVSQAGKEWYKKHKEAKSEHYVMYKERAKKTATAWRKKNPDYIKEWKKSNPDYYKEWEEKNPDYRIQYRYGLSQADYNNLLAQQNNRCAICREESKDGKSLHVDHDHSCCPGERSCGKCVRQLLCGHCNRMLGFAKDNPDTLSEGAKYVKRHSRSENLDKISDHQNF